MNMSIFDVWEETTQKIMRAYAGRISTASLVVSLMMWTAAFEHGDLGSIMIACIYLLLSVLALDGWAYQKYGRRFIKY
jgi:hypothetical protein